MFEMLKHLSNLRKRQQPTYICHECRNLTPFEEIIDNEGLCRPCRMARDERLKEAGQ